MQIKIKSYIVFFIILQFFLASCQVENISENQLKLERYSLRISELPSGWIFDGENWSRQLDGDTYLVAYGVKDNISVRIGHSISLYASKDKADEAFLKWEDKWLDAVEEWAGAEFTPINAEDVFLYECQQVISSLLSCSFLQRHENFVIHVLVTLDNKSMTLDQFNEILKILDKRLNETSFE